MLQQDDALLPWRSLLQEFDQLPNPRRSRPWRLLIALLAGCIAGLLLHRYLLVTLGREDTKLVLPVALGAGAAAAFFRLGVWPPDPARVAALISRAGVCLGCGYRLRGLPVEQDGCTVCPECGAAWNITPRQQPAQSRAGEQP